MGEVNKKAVTNIDNIIDVLKENQGKKFTARQIAEALYDRFTEECETKKQESRQERIQTHDGLIGQLAGEINREITRFKDGDIPIRIVDESPKKFYYFEQSETSDIDEIKKAERDLQEEDLYPLLSEYLNIEFPLLPKRIDEKHSSNKYGAGGNKWLYPDLVALEAVSENWDKYAKNCAQLSGGRLARLWSFEVKVILNRSNIRKSFFQTTSNSFWANYGYLVVSEITDTLEGSQMLFDAYGIGLMQLNTDNPTDSKVLISAKEREVNWDMANRLVKANTDFRDYMRAVDIFISRGEIRKEDWDL